MITQVSDSLYTQLVKSFGENRPSVAPHSLDEIRKQAFERFQKAGFPTVKQEDWKYTSVHSLVSQQYELEADSSLAPVDLDQADLPQLDAYRIVLVDGKYRAELSDDVSSIAGLSVLPIEQAFERLCFAKYFAGYADKTDNPFVALNTALFTSGLFIEVGKNEQLKKPIHVVHVSASRQPLFNQVRNLYVMSPFAEAEIVESFIT